MSKATKYGTTKWTQERLKRARQQGEVCSICRTSISLKAFAKAHLDHCHKTGKLRGVLCKACNLGLGNFKDDPILLQRAIHYLMLHS